MINKFTDEIGGALLERRLLLFFLFFILFYLFYQNNWVRLAGDEPNYLLMASSIASDFDLDLRNNYLNHDYENFAFIPFRLPDGLQGSSPIYAVHEPGLAILLSPLFWLYYNGTTSINLVELSKIVMLLFTSLAALNLFLTVKNLKLFKRDENILLLTLGASFLLPFAAYQGQIFPDTVAVGLIAFIFRKLETESETNGSKSRRFSIIFCIIILPWLHIKFALVALLFGLRFLLKNFKKLKDLKKGLLKNIIPGILLITGALAILIYNNLLFGTFLPGSFTGRISGFELKTIRVAGLFFDADFGLINLSPVFITLLAAHIIVFIRYKALSIRLILYSAALFLPHALFSHWWLGFCPAGRPFVSPFLLLTLPIFFYISALGWRNLVYTLPLFILSFLITILFMQRPNLFYHADGNPFENSVGNYLTRIGSFDFSSFFISYPFAQMNYYYPLFIMTLIFASILFIFWSGKSQR